MAAVCCGLAVRCSLFSPSLSYLTIVLDDSVTGEQLENIRLRFNSKIIWIHDIAGRTPRLSPAWSRPVWWLE